MTEESFNEISDLLDRGLIPGGLLLSQFRMLDESSREAPAYQDARYAPFYYYLGRCCPCRRLLALGFGLGIAAGSYVRGCNTVEKVLAFQQSGKNYYSPRLGIHNVKDYFKGDLKVHIGNVVDLGFDKKINECKWDIALVDEDANYDTMLEHMELAWDHLALDGILVVEYVQYHNGATAAYRDFCVRKNRKQRIVPTRYGVGIITR